MGFFCANSRDCECADRCRAQYNEITRLREIVRKLNEEIERLSED